MTAIQFWYSAGSCSLAPHALLHESGLPFTAIELSISRLETQTEAFTRINPKQRVPVIAMNGEVITELPAIAAAISQRVPELGFMGQSAIEQIRVMEWMCWLSGEVHGQCFGGLFRPERFIDDPRQFEAIQAKARERIVDAFNTIESKLAGDYAVGNGLTIVDPYLLVFYRWGNNKGIDMPDRYPGYTAYVRKLAAYPAIATAMEKEGISL